MLQIEGKLNGEGLAFAIAVSRFNHLITDRLVEGAIDSLVRHGVAREDITVVRVPGAFEMPAVVSRLVLKKGIDAVVCLGAVIRGSTPHFDFVASEVSKGIAQISLSSPVPVTYGILTCDTIEQAIERAGTKSGNKGADAALAALEMARLFEQLSKDKQ